MSHQVLNLHKAIETDDFKTNCVNSVKDVFQNMYQADLYEVAAPTAKPKHEVSAVISFLNENVEAVLQLSCHRQTILNLVKSSYGAEFSETQSVFFLGESINIIFGMLKEQLSLLGFNYDKCLPIVLAGQDHIILNLLDAEVLEQHYASPHGNITLKIGLNDRNLFTRVAS